MPSLSRKKENSKIIKKKHTRKITKKKKLKGGGFFRKKKFKLMSVEDIRIIEVDAKMEQYMHQILEILDPDCAYKYFESESNKCNPNNIFLDKQIDYIFIPLIQKLKKLKGNGMLQDKSIISVYLDIHNPASANSENELREVDLSLFKTNNTTNPTSGSTEPEPDPEFGFGNNKPI